MTDHNDPDALAGDLIPRHAPVRVCYLSQSPFGARFRHRYHPTLNKWARQVVPEDARRWDSDCRAYIITYEHWADAYAAKARECGFTLAEDDFTADTRRPKGYQRTWADTLSSYVPFEHRAEILGEVAAVLERHAGKGPKVGRAAGQVRKYLSWAA